MSQETENRSSPVGPPDDRPWETLEQIVELGDAEALDQFLQSLPASEAARALSRLDHEDQVRVLTTLPPDVAADLIQEISDAQAIDLVELLRPQEAAQILNEMDSDEQADLLSELDREDARAILAVMDPEEAQDARRLAQYDPGTAGGLMISEYLAFHDDMTVRDVLEDLQANAEEYADYDVQYAYIVHATGVVTNDSPGELVGVLRLRDLLLSPSNRPVAQVMVHEPLSVRVDATLDELADFFDRHEFYGVPVVDPSNRLVGVVRRHDVEEALSGRADRNYLKIQGIVGGEELRTMPLTSRAGWRLAWLTANIGLNLIAVSVIAFYEETLAAVIALAVFLPLISDMGGNAGVQAIAVSIRELSLGLIKPYEILWVATKEASVGLVNGVVLGLLVGLAGFIWKGNLYLGLVVGAAMMINTLVATVVGGAMPLILQRWKLDPALASGPILTTITDMTGFFFVLSFATLLLPKLMGS